jgi:hypothetical protein
LAEEAKTKKVKAYPILVNLQLGTVTVPAQILKLTPQGFLAETAISTLKPGDRLSCTFALPVTKAAVTSAGVLVKLYNQWNGSQQVDAAPAASLGKTAATVATVATDATTATTATPAISATPQPVTQIQGAPPRVIHLIEIHFQNLDTENRTRISSFLKMLQKAGGGT